MANNISGTIGLVNVVNNSFNSVLLTPSNYFVRTVSGVNRVGLFFDSDIFNEQILISASLLIGTDEVPFRTHYNTTHDEITDGTNWQPLDKITIAINPKPKKTQIIGLRRMDINSIHEYKIDDNYDPNNLFTYDWFLTGSANFPDNGNSQTFLNAGKNIRILFTDADTVSLRVRVGNSSGCFLDIMTRFFPGTLTKKLLVVRNPYF